MSKGAAPGSVGGCSAVRGFAEPGGLRPPAAHTGPPAVVPAPAAGGCGAARRRAALIDSRRRRSTAHETEPGLQLCKELEL